MDKDSRKGNNSVKLSITGATGFIGFHLVKKLSQSSSYSIKCLVRKSSDISNLKKLNVDVVTCDFLDKESVKNSIKGSDVVIHLASLLESNKNKEEIFSTNVKMLQNIIDCFSDIKQLIFTSTNVALDPHSFYAKSKVKCEDLIKSSDINYTILRIAPVLGQGSNSKSAELIRKINSDSYIPIPGDGKQVLQPVHVNDVSDAIKKTIMNKEYFKRICAVSGEPIALEEYVDLIGKVLDHKVKKFHVPVGLLRFVIKFYEKIVKNPEISSGQIDDLKNLTKNNAIKSDFDITTLSNSIKDTIS